MNITQAATSIAAAGLALFGAMPAHALPFMGGNDGLGAEVRTLARGRWDDDKKGNKEKEYKANVSGEAAVRINERGEVSLGGLTATSVSGATVNGTILVNGVAMPWVVVADGNTRVIDRNGAAVQVGSIAAGNTLKVEGMIIGFSASGPVIQAKTIRNTTADMATRRVFQGTLKAISGSVPPVAMTVAIGGADYTVRIAADTSLLTKTWGKTTLGAFQAGHTIRVYGAASGTIVDAVVVRNLSVHP